MEKQATCKERVGDRLDSRMEDLRALWATYLEDPEAYNEDVQSNMYEYGLCFDYVEEFTWKDQPVPYYRYQLSWGGPSDEFRIYAPKEAYSKPYRIEYWFLDWFDGASRTLYGEDLVLLTEIFHFLRAE